MPNLKKLVNKHTISLATSAAMPVIGMLVLSLMAHNLPAADFGNYIFLLITILLADTFRNGFVQTSLIKFYAGTSKKKAFEVAGSAWYVGLMQAGVFVAIDAIVYLVYRSKSVNAETTIQWFGIIYMTTLPATIASYILQAEEKFGRMLILQVINQGLFLVLILTLIFLHKLSFQTAVYAYFAGSAVTSLFTIFNGWSKIRTLKYRTKETVRKLAHFGKFSVGTSISSYLLRSSDTFIIKIMFNPALLAVYYIPQRLMEIFEIPMRAGVATAMPELSAAVHKGNQTDVANIMKRYAGMLTVALIPIAVVAFLIAGPVITILFGKQYQDTEAVNIFRLFMCYVMLMPIDRFFGITLDIINKPHLNMLKVILMLIVNITGDFIGIFIFHSLYAVAIASLFTFFSGAIFGYWALKKHLHFTIRDMFSLGYAELKSIVSHLLEKTKTEKAEV
ncbi:oligosaccharide flippase family protein [Mucilaginibacter sp. RB4R14]|uniref:oligosaccharide flippase family protein n=1 Tax=Mucilaginibacter aurantiaciroseus TaxID=2949308 RepID=UPI002090717F|nr:oligosaccharide flippase family protein [Mucilaginibacter aurantiaciroseus]MCO5935204.1 oligosaccharide flippase family protein [Mucilaginibacter aurantiaciroseus]